MGRHRRCWYWPWILTLVAAIGAGASTSCSGGEYDITAAAGSSFDDGGAAGSSETGATAGWAGHAGVGGTTATTGGRAGEGGADNSGQAGLSVDQGGSLDDGGASELGGSSIGDSGGSSGNGAGGTSGRGGSLGSGTGGVANQSTGGSSTTGGADAGGSTGAGGTGGGNSEGGGEQGGAGENGGANSSGGSTGGAGASFGGSGDTGGSGATGNTGQGGMEPDQHRFLLRDEGLRTLSYVDLGNSDNNWYVRVQGEEQYPGLQGRDLQLVGEGRVMVGTPNGYEEYLIADGTRVTDVATFPNTLSAYRLRNRNTLLATTTSGSIELDEVDAASVVVHTITYPGYSYVRLVRPTPDGTFLVAANDVVFEGDADGNVIQSIPITGAVALPHVWKALRLTNGDTVVATGYDADLRIFTSAGTVRRSISGPSSVDGLAIDPYFYSDFQVLSNGNYLVVNWQGHLGATCGKGVQLLEYTPAGTLTWYWEWQKETYADQFCSLQGAILLDGLDTSKLYVEDAGGALVPVD